MASAVVMQMLHSVNGLGRPWFDGAVESGLYTAAECIAVGICVARVFAKRRDRGAWLLITLGLLTWTAGDAVWTIWLDRMANPPDPSIADALYLSWYPAVYVAVVLLLRSHYRHSGAAVWLDGMVVGLTAAALGAAFILPDVLAERAGNAAADAVNLAYPLGDLLLLIFIAVGFALSGWRPGRQWALLGLGIAVSACADMIFLYQTAHGTYVAGRILDSIWPVSMALIALAAWQPAVATLARRSSRPHTVVLPAAFGMVALALLVSATLHPLTHLAVALATAALLAASARAALTYLENVRILEHQSRYAITDALTGLGNRRRLNDELDRAVSRAAHGQPSTLAFFDLNGFKRYNDTFGHGAGDALLARLGAALAVAVEGSGSAYRLGGDEFCVLLAGRFAPGDSCVAPAEAALVERGRGFAVDASRGVVVVPDEAGTAASALALADRRMYANKGRGGRSSDAQIQGVLMQLLGEREPELHSRLRDVGLLALAVGRRFDLDSEQLDELRRAAELHDVGKLAMPDEIVNKTGSLTGDELRFIQQHPIVGQRILDVAPALSQVAQLIRSTHERWDGAGYPDGLVGAGIPTGSRIIAACDAFTAMTSGRPYNAARSPRQALNELERGAGSQFDPAVVAAIREHLATHAPSGGRARSNARASSCNAQPAVSHSG